MDSLDAVRQIARRTHDRENSGRSQQVPDLSDARAAGRAQRGEGDHVHPGQSLAVVEAMKMENILRAEKAGTVKSVNAKAGDSLAVDAVILEME